MNTSLFSTAKNELDESYSDPHLANIIKSLEDNDFKNSEDSKIAGDFRKRFGIDRLIYKNRNMIDVLKNPTRELEGINKDYQILTAKMAQLWRRVYLSLIEAGYSVEESKRRADEYIAPLIIAETKLIKARHPFALGGAKKDKSTLMEQLYHRMKGADKAGKPVSARALVPEGKGKEKEGEF
jgi:hypothetical protein